MCMYTMQSHHHHFLPILQVCIQGVYQPSLIWKPMALLRPQMGYLGITQLLEALFPPLTVPDSIDKWPLFRTPLYNTPTRITTMCIRVCPCVRITRTIGVDHLWCPETGTYLYRIWETVKGGGWFWGCHLGMSRVGFPYFSYYRYPFRALFMPKARLHLGLFRTPSYTIPQRCYTMCIRECPCVCITRALVQTILDLQKQYHFQGAHLGTRVLFRVIPKVGFPYLAIIGMLFRAYLCQKHVYIQRVSVSHPYHYCIGGVEVCQAPIDHILLCLLWISPKGGLQTVSRNRVPFGKWYFLFS